MDTKSSASAALPFEAGKGMSAMLGKAPSMSFKSTSPGITADCTVGEARDELLPDSLSESYPRRPPRVSEEHYQVKLPFRRRRSAAAFRREGVQSEMVWGNCHTLSRLDVDEFIRFTRQLEGTMNASGMLDPRESDEEALEWLCRNDFDITRAKFVLTSTLAAGKDVDWFKLAADAAVVNRKGGSNRASSPAMDGAEASNSVSSSKSSKSSKANDTKKAWARWVSLARNALVGKPKPCTPSELRELQRAAADLPRLLAKPDDDTSVSFQQTSFETLAAVGHKLSEIDLWIAQAHDAVSYVTPDNALTVEELDSLVAAVPKGAILVELNCLSKILAESKALEQRANALLLSRAVVESDLREILRDFRRSPLSFTTVEVSLMAKLRKADEMAEKILSVVPRERNWRSSGIRDSLQLQPLSILEQLHDEIQNIGVRFPEADLLASYLRSAQQWLARVASSLEGGSSDLRAMAILAKQAESIPVDLAKEKKQLEDHVHRAQEWVKRVRNAVPRKKTRGAGDFQKMDIDTLRTLQSEAGSIGVDVNEVSEMADVMESAEDWLSRVRETLEHGDAAELQTLNSLLSEADGIPVQMDEERTLRIEIKARVWAVKARKVFEGCGRLRLNALEELLDEANVLRSTLPRSAQKSYRLPEEVQLAAIVETARDWTQRAKKISQDSRKSSAGSKSASAPTLAEVEDLLEEVKDVPANVSHLASPLRKIARVVRRRQSRIRALLIATGQATNDDFMASLKSASSVSAVASSSPDITSTDGSEDSSSDSVDEDDRVLSKVSGRKLPLALLEAQLRDGFGAGATTFELEMLQTVVNRSRTWLVDYAKISPTAAPSKRSKSKGGSGISEPKPTVQQAEQLILDAEKLPIPLMAEVQQIQAVLNAMQDCRSKASAAMALYHQRLREMRTVAIPKYSNDKIDMPNDSITPDGSRQRKRRRGGNQTDRQHLDERMGLYTTAKEAVQLFGECQVHLTMQAAEVSNASGNDKTMADNNRKTHSNVVCDASASSFLSASSSSSLFISIDDDDDGRIKLVDADETLDAGPGWNCILDDSINAIKDLLSSMKVAMLKGELSVSLDAPELRSCRWLRDAALWCVAASDALLGTPSLNLEESRQLVLDGCRLAAMKGDPPLPRKVGKPMAIKRAKRTVGRGGRYQRIREKAASRTTAASTSVTASSMETNLTAAKSTKEVADDKINGKCITTETEENEKLPNDWSQPYMQEVEGDHLTEGGIAWCLTTRLERLRHQTRLAMAWQHIAQLALLRDSKRPFNDHLCALRNALQCLVSKRIRIKLGPENEVRLAMCKIRAWRIKARSALTAKPVKWTAEAIEELIGDELQTLVATPDEAAELHAVVKASRSWLQQVRQSGIEQGDASVAELRVLLDQAATIKVDLSEHTKVLELATRQYCICRAAYDGFMIGCDYCDEWFHAQCLNLSQSQARRLDNFRCPMCQVRRVLKLHIGLGKGSIARILAAAAANPTIMHPIKEEEKAILSDIDAHARTSSAEQNVLFRKMVHWLQQNNVAGLLQNAAGQIDCKRNHLPGDMQTTEETRVLTALKDAEACGIAALIDIQAVTSSLRMMVWAPRAIHALSQKSSLPLLEQLTTTATLVPIKHDGIVEVLTQLVHRSRQWVSKARQVLASPPSIASASVVAQCKQLQKLLLHLPVEFSEEKAIIACIEDSATRYCLCRGFNDGGFMIGCDVCEEWFHGRCVNLEKAYGETLTSWTCPRCLPLPQQGAMSQVQRQLPETAKAPQI